MQTINIHEAKTHLSKLIEKAAKGEPFIIAKAGKPLVKVTALDSPTGEKMRRLGNCEESTRPEWMKRWHSLSIFNSRASSEEPMLVQSHIYTRTAKLNALHLKPQPLIERSLAPNFDLPA